MKSACPPSLATWLLERFIHGEENEALAGDLLEEFNRGRSARWYWYQVLVAMLAAFSKELRAHWIAILFAAVVSGAFPYK
jgi:hypothetical protein